MTAAGCHSLAFQAYSRQVISKTHAATTTAVCSQTPSRCVRCHAEGSGGRQYETEFFRKLFGTPPEPKADSAGGGDGTDPPGSSQIVDEEEEPDEEQIQLAKQKARQQALFNCITLSLFCGVLASVSTWQPDFLYLGRVWRVVHVGDQAKAYTERFSEALAWATLLTMGWPWNLLIYPAHLTRKEFTNARQEHRGPSFATIKSSVWNPFAKRRPPPSLA